MDINIGNIDNIGELIDIENIYGMYGEELSDKEKEFIKILSKNALQLIHINFLERGKNIVDEIKRKPYLIQSINIVTQDLVLSYIKNPNGVRTMTSQRGPIQDSITFADVNKSGVGLMMLSDNHLKLLGLYSTTTPTGIFDNNSFEYPENIIGEKHNNYREYGYNVHRI